MLQTLIIESIPVENQLIHDQSILALQILNDVKDGVNNTLQMVTMEELLISF